MGRASAAPPSLSHFIVLYGTFFQHLRYSAYDRAYRASCPSKLPSGRLDGSIRHLAGTCDTAYAAYRSAIAKTRILPFAAWASVANRPGQNHSYTNNFPYDPSVGNTPIPGAILWSALSLLVLLAGIAAVLLAFGKFDYLGWISRGHVIRPYAQPGEASPGQRALVKFYVLVALVFLFQTLVGGATAHYRADPAVSTASNSRTSFRAI